MAINFKPRGKPRGKPFVKGEDPRRHILSKAELRKGFAVFAARVKAGLIPSRVAVSVRNKPRRAKQAAAAIANGRDLPY